MNNYSKSNEVDTYNSRFIVVMYHTHKTYKDLRGNPSDVVSYYSRRHTEDLTIEEELLTVRNLIMGEVAKKANSNPIKTILLINNLNKGRHLKGLDNKQLYKLLLNRKTGQYQGFHIQGISENHYEIARTFEELLNS